MKTKTLHKVVFFSMVLLFIAWIILIINHTPQEIIDFIGVKNAYLIAFIICFLGGISILIPIPYYLVIITLGAGGANPFLLGLFGGLGQATGDTTSYAVGYTGKHILPNKLQKLFNKLFKWLQTKSYFIFFLTLMAFGSLIPLPNDLLVIPLGLAHYPYLKTIIPLGIGNIIFNTTMALIGFYGFSLFF